MRARACAHAREEAVGRQDDADVGERRLGDDRGDLAAVEHPLQRVEVVEGDEPRVRRGTCVEAEQVGRAVVLVARDERVVEMAVVVALEHCEQRSARAMAGEPDRLGVRAGRRERELPAGQAVAVAEELGGGDALLDGEQELQAARGPLRDRFQHRGRGEAARGAQVRLVEVEVLVAVDVGEAAAGAVRDVDRVVVVETGHPGHRDAVGHQRARALRQRGRPARPAAERRALGGVELAEPGAIDRGRHAVSMTAERVRASRTRRGTSTAASGKASPRRRGSGRTLGGAAARRRQRGIDGGHRSWRRLASSRPRRDPPRARRRATSPLLVVRDRDRDRDRRGGRLRETLAMRAELATEQPGSGSTAHPGRLYVALRREVAPRWPRATGAGRAPVKQPRFATTLKQLCTDFAPCGVRPCVATGARSMVVRPCPPRSSPTRCWPRPCRAWDRSRRSRSRAPGSPTRRCTRCSASRRSGAGSARRSRPPSPAATCSSSCRPVRASRSATSFPRSCART